MKYYFIVNSFPSLVLGMAPQMSYEETREMLRLNLTSSDWEQIVLFQRQIDLRNFRAFWLKEPLDSRGNFGEKEIEEALLVKDFLPLFVIDFLDRYESTEDRLRYSASLFASLYSEAMPKAHPFLRRLYQLEREIRLSLTALRAKAGDRDLSRELQFEDPFDPFVAQLLAQKEGEQVTLPQEYEDLKTAFLKNSSEPKQLQEAILQFRLERIEEMEVSDLFGLGQILGYLARLIIVEDWAQLNEKQGESILHAVASIV